MTETETLTRPTPAAAPAVPEGYMKDAKGRLVPVGIIKPTELLEDQLVGKLMGYADDLSAQIRRFHGHCLADVGALLDLLREQYGVSRGGQKGNLTFTSFDGLLRVTIKVADRLTFGPELQVAKELVDECIAEWSAGTSDEIRMLVNHAFQVDKEGQVSRDRLFALRRVRIDDARWQRAMDAIVDSIRIVGSKEYITFHRRTTPTGKWEPVTISLAAA